MSSGVDDGKPWQDRGLLERLYVDKGLRSPDIAEKFGCSDMTVRRWLHEFDIDVSGNEVSKDEMIKDARGLARWLGHEPSFDDYEEFGRYGSTTIGNKMGGWVELRKEAKVREEDGFPPANHKQKYSREELRAELERLMKKHGEVTTRIMESEGEYSHATYAHRFGSWNDGLRALGFEINKENSLDRDDLINMLRGLGQMLDRTPTLPDIDEHTHHAQKTIYWHFEDFDEALEAAGFIPSRVSSNCANCGAELSRQRCHVLKRDNFYCDIHCQSEWRSEHITGENHWGWKGGPDYYGENWNEQREAAIKRDQHRCQGCGKTEEESLEMHGRELSVHHIRPINDFDSPETANELSNLVSLCNACHTKWEGIPVRPKLLAEQSG